MTKIHLVWCYRMVTARCNPGTQTQACLAIQHQPPPIPVLQDFPKAMLKNLEHKLVLTEKYFTYCRTLGAVISEKSKCWIDKLSNSSVLKYHVHFWRNSQTLIFFLCRKSMCCLTQGLVQPSRDSQILHHTPRLQCHKTHLSRLNPEAFVYERTTNFMREAQRIQPSLH